MRTDWYSTAKFGLIQPFGVLVVVALFFNPVGLSAQIGIGTYSPDSATILDVSSTSKGVLVPSMTSDNISKIKSPADGLLVFQTDDPIGFRYWDASEAAWKVLYRIQKTPDTVRFVADESLEALNFADDAFRAEDFASNTIEYHLNLILEFPKKGFQTHFFQGNISMYVE